MQLICACLSERKIYNDLVEHSIAGHLIRTPYSLFKTNNSSKMSPTTCTKDHIQSFLLAAYYNSFMLYLRLSQSYKLKSRCAFEENETVSYSRLLQSNNIFPLTEFTQFREIERHFNRENVKIPLWDWSYKLGLTKQDFVPRTQAFHKEKALFLYFDSLKNQTSLSEEIISCHCAESLRAILQQKNFRDSHSIAVFTGELQTVMGGYVAAFSKVALSYM